MTLAYRIVAWMLYSELVFSLANLAIGSNRFQWAVLAGVALVAIAILPSDPEEQHADLN